MIKIFPNTPAGRVAAAAELPVDGKKELSVNAEQIVVTTGDDVFVPPSSRIITTEAFRDRFTSAELLAIVASTDAQIKYALLKLSTKEQPLIDLDNAEVIATMDRLVTLSLVTASSKTATIAYVNEIL